MIVILGLRIIFILDVFKNHTKYLKYEQVLDAVDLTISQIQVNGESAEYSTCDGKFGTALNIQLPKFNE